MIDWARIKRAFAGQPEPVTKPNPLKDFDNLAELRTWCESHKELRLEITHGRPARWRKRTAITCRFAW
jgi:hypothetical protein